MRSALLQVETLWWREIVRFGRYRSRVAGAFLQPLVFWALLGAGLKASFRPSGMPGGMNYAQYFYPGVIVLVLVFTAIFATVSTIEDRKQGFLQGVLVAPISRSTVVLGQALGGATIALMQGVIFLVLAPFAGIHLDLAAVVSACATMAAVAFGLTSVGLLLAWRIESTQGFHAIMNLILIPVWLLSGAFFPETGLPGWLRWPMLFNPLTYGMTALRRALYLGDRVNFPTLAAFGYSAIITVMFAVMVFLAAVRIARRAATV
jgi:ABC-2 type transport system permease protein